MPLSHRLLLVACIALWCVCLVSGGESLRVTQPKSLKAEFDSGSGEVYSEPVSQPTHNDNDNDTDTRSAARRGAGDEREMMEDGDTD